MYVRIDFPQNPPRKPVHNTDDHVEYISIDWNKKAEPLPDEEEEKEEKWKLTARNIFSIAAYFVLQIQISLHKVLSFEHQLLIVF